MSESVRKVSEICLKGARKVPERLHWIFGRGASQGQQTARLLEGRLSCDTQSLFCDNLSIHSSITLKQLLYDRIFN
jgi:hypothetical protein